MKTRHQIKQGDALDLHFIEDNSIDLIVTSPPYFGQREYLDENGEVIHEAVGSEATIDEYLKALDRFMDEAWRVIKPSGSVFVNLGDKYEGSGGHNNANIAGEKWDGEKRRDAPTKYVKKGSNARRKSLMGLPWRFAISQIDRGWVLRAEIIWNKPSGMPEGNLTDRVGRKHEQWFHFTKEEIYFSSIDPIREPLKTEPHKPGNKGWPSTRNDSDRLEKVWGNPLGKPPTSVQTISTSGSRPTKKERETFNLPDHFAPFPAEWPRFFILGWSPEGGIVLDPFAGTGTTALVAQILNRNSISVDLSPAYVRLMNWRVRISDHGAKIEKKWRKKGLL